MTQNVEQCMGKIKIVKFLKTPKFNSVYLQSKREVEETSIIDRVKPSIKVSKNFSKYTCFNNGKKYIGTSPSFISYSEIAEVRERYIFQNYNNSNKRKRDICTVIGRDCKRSRNCYSLIDDLSIQSGIFESFASLIAKKIAALGGSVTQEVIIEYFHTFLWVVCRINKVEHWIDVQSILDYITRIHLGKPVYVLLFEWALGEQLEAQSMDWSILKKILTGYSAIKTHPVIIKFLKLVGLAFAGGIFSFFGKEVEMAELWQLMTEGMSKIRDVSDFVMAVMDFFYYIGERIIAFCTTGKWTSLFYTPTHFSEWADKASDIIEKSVAISNLSAIGEDYHTFMSTLNKLIVDGEEIKRYIKSGEGSDIVAFTLTKLKSLRNSILVKDACGKSRAAPFSMLFSAGSGQGKSSLIDTVITHFGLLYNKPLEDEFIYTRTPGETHWNNFKSHMWACILDDIACMNPATASEDPTLKDLIQVKNNVAFSTPQADLVDKGKSPFMCELVIATTNTKDLKAHCWFNNPQAIRRRLPYIIDAIPKKEYRVEGSHQLDENKVPITMEGCYPDLWDITVEKVTLDEKQTVVTQTILQTSSVYEFISAFNSWTEKHKLAQAAFLASKEAGRAAKLCNEHKIPVTACGCDRMLIPQGAQLSSALAGGAVTYGTYQFMEFSADSIRRALSVNPEFIDRPAMLTLAVARASAQRVNTTFTNATNSVKSFCRKKLKEAVLSGFDTIYEVVGPKVKICAIVLASFGAVGLTWKFMKKEFPEIVELESQGNIAEVGIIPESKKEPENIWKKDDYVPSEFLGRLAESWSTLPLSQVASIVGRNVVWCKITRGENIKRHTIFRALCVGGHLYVTTSHCIPKDDYLSIQVLHENPIEGCNGNVTFKLSQDTIYRCEERELVFFQNNHMPVRRDLRQLFPSRGFKIAGPGRLVTRFPNGEVGYLTSKATKSVPQHFVEQFNKKLDIIYGVYERDTDVGDCGSPIITQMPNCSVIAGLHILGGQQNTGVGAMIFSEDIVEAERFFEVPIIDSVQPDLFEKDLSKLISQKCVARYIEDGSVEVYGSFTGFKTQPKSTAINTRMHNYVTQHKGWVNKYGPAPMKGYMPLRLGILPMVQKKHLFKENILHACAETFISEVLSMLPQSEKDELKEIYNVKVAVNGLPGLKYVDSMNFSTSAGFPYNKSKNNFITRLPGDSVWQNPVQLSEVITDDIQRVWDRMTSGQRSGIIFMQHIKDEVLPLTKVHAEKARLFMGGPFGWSVAVRMALLPFIRVMQRNKYVFECAPGTNATSVEWTRLYQYLSKYGTDNAIAGDFKAFDKAMGSLVILKAFYCIHQILKNCGASSEHLIAVWSIAEDVSFAFCNFNGDLMQFYGSNPSGHPLTVIINCIVNSLYMRYCYTELSPDKNCKSFRDSVRLITYGDDNAMTSNKEWFNHTSIARVLSGVGIEYTMADKTSDSRPFIKLSEVSFLKRTFVWSKDLKVYLAQLDENSIKKSIMMCVPSKTECHEKQCVDIIRSAISEYFFYGKSKFDEMTIFLKDVVEKCDLSFYVEENTFETWDNLCKRFEKASLDYLEWEPESSRHILGHFDWENREKYGPDQ